MDGVLSISLPNIITITIIWLLGFLLIVVLYQLVGRSGVTQRGPGASAYALFGSIFNQNAA